jgi:aerobic C4-dicarboxylate transport protein
MGPISTTDQSTTVAEPQQPKKKTPFYLTLWGQVLIGVALAIIYGYFSPVSAAKMKPLGDGFIRLITMVITVIIFCTVVTGIAGMENLKKVGRIGGKALLYFEIVSTLALFTGMLVGNVTHPGSGFNINPATLDAKSVADYAGAAKQQSVTEFLMNIIPTTMVDAFAKGNILQVLLVATLFGFALSIVGEKSRMVVELFDAMTHAVFGVINIVMKLAPIGAFGAMAFTVGKYGIASLGPLAKLIVIFYATCIFFVLVVFGVIAWISSNFLPTLRKKSLSCWPPVPQIPLCRRSWPRWKSWVVPNHWSGSSSPQATPSTLTAAVCT